MVKAPLLCALAEAEADERVLVAEEDPEEALLVAEAEEVAEEAPVVEVVFLGSNLFWVYR